MIDRWNFANLPDAPVLPKARSRMVVTDVSTATHRIMQFSEPLDNDTQGETDLLAYKAAREAHKQAVADKLTQSRVPHLSKLFERTQKTPHPLRRATHRHAAGLAGRARRQSLGARCARGDRQRRGRLVGARTSDARVAEDAMRLHAASVLA